MSGGLAEHDNYRVATAAIGSTEAADAESRWTAHEALRAAPTLLAPAVRRRSPLTDGANEARPLTASEEAARIETETVGDDSI